MTIHVYEPKLLLSAKCPLINTNESSDPPYKGELRVNVSALAAPSDLAVQGVFLPPSGIGRHGSSLGWPSSRLAMTGSSRWPFMSLLRRALGPTDSSV